MGFRFRSGVRVLRIGVWGLGLRVRVAKGLRVKTWILRVRLSTAQLEIARTGTAKAVSETREKERDRQRE